MGYQTETDKIKIQEIIEKNPGIYLSKITEIIKLNISEVENIIRELEKENIIHCSFESGYKRYFKSKKTEHIHENKVYEIREIIYQLIKEKPGLYLSKIAEHLEMSVPLAEYHLSSLEKSGKIVTIKEKGFRRYYTKTEELGAFDRKTIALLRQKLPLQIVILLLKNSQMRHKDLMNHFDLAPSTLSYHLSKLLKQGIIDVKTYGKEKGYQIVNKRVLISYLTKYKIYTMAENLGDTWFDIKY